MEKLDQAVLAAMEESIQQLLRRDVLEKSMVLVLEGLQQADDGAERRRALRSELAQLDQETARLATP